ncbi:MAG: class II aldolase/adducin family protein [Gammaproteobacteria bacterium]
MNANPDTRASQTAASPLSSKISTEEWQARVALAALYRLVALHGWDDMIFTHISARVPGPEHHFLINPYGWFFGEITASCLVKVDLQGKKVDDNPQPINPAGFTIHSAIHAARAEAQFVVHVHTDAGVAVSAQEAGLLPITQHALIVLPALAYHDYEGIALNLDERQRIVADLGDKSLLLLRNHGTLALGPTACDAFLGLFMLERACQQQVMALSAGAQGVRHAPAAARDEVKTQMAMMGPMAGKLAWPGLLRKLDRESPGYDA